MITSRTRNVCIGVIFCRFSPGARTSGLSSKADLHPEKADIPAWGYIVNTNHAGLEFVVVINEALWNNLSGMERAIIKQAAEQVEQDLRMSYRQIHQETLDWIIANTTMEVSDLNTEQRSAWRQVAAPIYQSYAKRAGQIGEDLLAKARQFQ